MLEAERGEAALRRAALREAMRAYHLSGDAMHVQSATELEIMISTAFPRPTWGRCLQRASWRRGRPSARSTRAPGCKPRVTNYKLQVTRYELQAASYKLHVTPLERLAREPICRLGADVVLDRLELGRHLLRVVAAEELEVVAALEDQLDRPYELQAARLQVASSQSSLIASPAALSLQEVQRSEQV